MYQLKFFNRKTLGVTRLQAFLASDKSHKRRKSFELNSSMWILRTKIHSDCRRVRASFAVQKAAPPISTCFLLSNESLYLKTKSLTFNGHFRIERPNSRDSIPSTLVLWIVYKFYCQLYITIWSGGCEAVDVKLRMLSCGCWISMVSGGN